MATTDWLVLLVTLLGVFFYGYWGMRKQKRVDSTTFLAGTRNLKWWTICLSIMATQASAVTFLSTPGQAFEHGMEFGQFYFGLPIAMIIIATFILPIYYKLQVTTAYEYLEERFGLPMRTFTALIFLVLRSVSSAITLLAPSIVLSIALGWNLEWTTLFMSVFVIIYTAFGGNEAVSRTQELQMSIMLIGLVSAFGYVLYQMPGYTASEAWQIAGMSGRTKLVDTSFSWTDRYNIWSAMFATVFLFLSYFGTDQSQVGRYLSGASIQESRTGLLLNGFLKIPMQLLVLAVGVMVFAFYQVNPAPLHFNPQNEKIVLASAYAEPYKVVGAHYDSLKQVKAQYLRAHKTESSTISQSLVLDLDAQIKQKRKEGAELITKADPSAKTTDSDYVFIHFVLHHFPVGLVGFVLAMIFCAAWSTTASELQALTAATINDIYRRSIRKGASDAHYLKAARMSTVLWGCFLAAFALKAGLFENLIQAVNMAGSVFYGTILGIFATAFYLKRVDGVGVMIGAAVAQTLVLVLFFGVSKDAYLWYIPLATAVTMVVGLAVSVVQKLGNSSV
jgi:solute:Na+ symporter, SSS family